MRTVRRELANKINETAGPMDRVFDGGGPVQVHHFIKRIVAIEMLPYKGIGSGIRKTLDDWRKIEFKDDRGGCLFTVTFQRSTEKSTGKVAG